MAIENATTLFVTLLALGVISWGYFRARTYGKYGILAWLQSILLMAPWLLFFGLFALGIYVNFAAILILFLLATGIYIYLGRKLREMSQEQFRHDRLNQTHPASTPSSESASPPESDSSSESSNNGMSGNATLPLPIPQIHPIPMEDLKQIQAIFGIDTFFATETIPYQDGAIFKGNLRGQPQETYHRLSEKLEGILGDRYRLFLVESSENKPVVIVLPRTNDPKPQTVAQNLLCGVLFLATGVTLLERGGIQYGFDLFEGLEHLPQALPIALGLWLILLAHELGHRIMARRHQIRLSWPLFIPAWQLGTFGAITRFESLLPNRSVLFDIAVAGPAVGGALSLGCLVLGLILPAGDFPIQLPTPFFQSSILVGTLAKAIVGDRLQATLLNLNPLFLVGWLGLVITAINLIPAGRLDGGRMVQAIYGRPMAGRTTIASLIFLVIASFANPLALYWAILIVFLQRQSERPSLEELTEPDDTRAALALLMLFLMLVTLLPLTPSLAGQLGIGAPTPQILRF